MSIKVSWGEKLEEHEVAARTTKHRQECEKAEAALRGWLKNMEKAYGFTIDVKRVRYATPVCTDCPNKFADCFTCRRDKAMSEHLEQIALDVRFVVSGKR